MTWLTCISDVMAHLYQDEVFVAVARWESHNDHQNPKQLGSTVETQYNKLENSFPAENAVSAVVQSEVETMFK